MYPESGWWVLAYTKFGAKVAAFVLYDTYDNFRLWAPSRDMIGLIRDIDLEVVLGNADNSNELFSL